MMTKSLERLKRLADRKKIKGHVSFEPYTVNPNYRYRLRVSIGFSTFAQIPLGFNAQEARRTLNKMAESQ